ncbi:MAG: NAD(P)-dependent oxidoreductase [Xanthomonadales bacterium]|nr:Glutamate synthase [NADPH] small chain [Xanthomonadales bacterium]MCC6592797.1 NAD(P)-dependent oxidoreductase [Xanthomonadales bacterium]MCE7931700.1 NAD(P)-dependent oxidoreductase [Xanthomonadales bacterium PRO6]
MTRLAHADIQAGRLSSEQLAQNFADIAPPLDRQQALLAAQRCFYCYEAPCTVACPTGIDIPSFIKRISSDNLKGAATDILSANILGGACARVCPTEILCEGSCVRNKDDDKPVQIGALQRYATDWVYASGTQLFERAAATGRRVAVVGAGPAGLACAHALARHGHEIVIFEALERSGGLNEYGIAAYKVPGFVQAEIDWLLGIGGIRIEHGRELGRNLALVELQRDFDAVFLGLGLGAVNALGLPGEHLEGVRNAVDFIAELRQCADLSRMPVGRRVVVIGGGNTAIDAAIQSRRLGAEEVTMVYRRGPETMGATVVEQAFARDEGVRIVHWARPLAINGENGVVEEVQFAYTKPGPDGRPLDTREVFTLAADSVLKAIGQVLDPVEGPALKGGRIAVDAEFRTSLPKVWAGGDCVGGKVDLTVQSVEDGKRAAASIHSSLNVSAG